MIRLFLIGVSLIISCAGFAQKGNKEVYFGNKAYRSGDLKTAVSHYEQALKVNPENNVARVNLAIAQSKLKAADASVKNFDKALKENEHNQILENKLNYDKGVTLAKDKKYQPAIDAFKKVLRNDPSDNEARENLQKAINELKKQQKQNKKQNKDQNKQQQQKKEEQKKQQQQNKQQQQQNKQQKMTKEQADKLLQALRNQEKNTRKKLQKKNGVPPPNGEDW